VLRYAALQDDFVSACLSQTAALHTVSLEGDWMSKPVSKRELLEMQIKTYEFYAGLIDRAIGGSRANTMPKWDEQRALEYRQLADGLREQLAEMDKQDAASAQAG
jgi:hypothetical protein